MDNLLQIIFQSGEFYNENNSFLGDFLINALGALIGTLTALAIFLLTIKHDRKKEKWNEEKTTSQRLHYFSSIMDSITDTVKKQSDCLKEFFEKQRQDILNIPLITLLPDNDLKRFLELQNHEDYFHAYLRKFGYSSEIVEEYRKFYSLVDFLKAQTDQLQDMLMKSMQFDHERKIRYKNIVENAMDDTARIFSTAKQENKISDFEIFLNQSLLNFYANVVDYSDLNYFQSNFVDPVKFGILKSFSNIDIAVQLASELKKATFIFSEIKMSNNGIADDFEKIHEKYSNACIKLEELTIKLRSKFEIKS